LASIQKAIDRYAQQQFADAQNADLAASLKNLSSRQREVLDLLLAGKRSKQIANQLGIGVKTVAKHRAIVLEKMHVESVVELIRLFADANFSHDTKYPPDGRHAWSAAESSSRPTVPSRRNPTRQC
jgi:FixJ family two-component response regulator